MHMYTNVMVMLKIIFNLGSQNGSEYVWVSLLVDTSGILEPASLVDHAAVWPGTDLNPCTCQIGYVIAHFNLIFVTGQTGIHIGF